MQNKLEMASLPKFVASFMAVARNLSNEDLAVVVWELVNRERLGVTPPNVHLWWKEYCLMNKRYINALKEERSSGVAGESETIT